MPLQFCLSLADGSHRDSRLWVYFPQKKHKTRGKHLKRPNLLMRILYNVGLWENPNCLKIQGFAIG
jgi:hypothetical protein